MASDFKRLLDQLPEQDWSVEMNANGHYKCTPPDTSKNIVVVADSGDHRAVHNAIRDLRSSGFLWPIPSKKELRALARQRQGDLSHVAEYVADEVYYPKDLDTLWNELKDSKTYFSLADEDLASCRTRLEEAQRAVREAEAERLKAHEQLRSKKREFDAAFESETEAAA